MHCILTRHSVPRQCKKPSKCQPPAWDSTLTMPFHSRQVQHLEKEDSLSLFSLFPPDVLSLLSKCCMSQGPAYYKTSCKSEWYRWKRGKKKKKIMSSCASAQILISSAGFRGLSVWACSGEVGCCSQLTSI